MRAGSGRLGAAIAVAGAATLLGLAAASGPFFVSSAGTALLEAELDTVGADHLTLLGVQASGALEPEAVRAADRQLRLELAERELPDATQQLVLEVTVDGQRANLIGREGTDEQLPPVLETAEGEFAAPAAIGAGRLGIGAGDDVEVQAGTDGVATVRLGEVVEDFDRDDMPPFWQPASGLLTAVDDPRIPPPPPALLAEPGHILDVIEELRRTAGATGFGGPWATVSWTVPFEGDLTLEQARALVPRVTTIRTMVVDPTTELGGLLATGGPPASVSGEQVDAALQRVERAVTSLAVPVRMLSWAGQALALAAVAVAVLLGGRRWLSRGRLRAARGVSAVSVGVRWAALLAVPIVAGVALGWWAAGVGTELLGPGAAIDTSVWRGVWDELAIAAAAAVLTVGIASGTASAAAAREPGPRGSIPPVAEVAAAVGVGVALWQVGEQGAAITVDTEGVLRLDALTLALPLLVVLAAALVGTRSLGLLLRHGIGGRARQGAWYLASRRLRSVGGATLGLVAVTASSAGLLVVASTLAASAEATIEEQVGVLIGADAALPLSRAQGVSAGVTAEDVGLPTSRVRRAPESLLDARHEVDVLAIDPATFAGVAYQPRRLGEVDVAALAALLARGGDTDAVPAVAVGASFPGIRSLTVGEVELAIEQVGSAPVFPGVTGDRPALVVPDGGPLEPDDAAAASRLAISMYPELWIDRGDLDSEGLVLHLQQVMLPSTGTGPGATGPREFVFADERRADPGLAPARWTFTYLRAQAAAIAVLGLVALLAHHRSRRRRGALASALAGRMGLGARRRTGAEAMELTVLLFSALILGGVAGLLGARTVLTDYDPLPEVTLPVVFAPPGALAPLALVVVAVLASVTVVSTRRAVDRADVAVLLRGGA